MGNIQNSEDKKFIITDNTKQINWKTTTEIKSFLKQHSKPVYMNCQNGMCNSDAFEDGKIIVCSQNNLPEIFTTMKKI